MEQKNIYRDIALRTGGDIYIGVVGPVRTGKSTFIKKFMEALVIPHIKSEFVRERATDELPQSAAGRTIMTTEPKFIPEDAVTVELDENASAQVRLIDCVGYIVPSSLGYFEDEAPRMVRTPWFEDEVPFNMAAEVGTRKVITDHSTLGLVITTDGSFTDIPREEYEEAEERVIRELSELQKPFLILLNSQSPSSAAARSLKQEMEEKYGRPVAAVNCLELTEEDIKGLLSQLLLEFPVREIAEIFRGYEIVSMQAAGFSGEIEETGKTFEENALIKARAVCGALHCAALADDSGLCVDALGGAPGVHSARFCGRHGDDAANNALLLEKLKGVPAEKRGAYFESSVALCFPDGREITAAGRTYGSILEEAEGEGGFGYDPLFYSDDLGKSFGTASPAEKNAVSHRARALEALSRKLAEEER